MSQAYATSPVLPSSDPAVSSFLGSNAQQQQQPRRRQQQQQQPHQLQKTQSLYQHQQQDLPQYTQLHTPKSMDGRSLDYSPSEPASATAASYHHQPNIKYEVRSPIANNIHSSVPPTPNSDYSAQQTARTANFADYAAQQQHRAYTESGAPQRYQPPTPSDLVSPGQQQQQQARGGMAQANGSTATSPSYHTHQQYSPYSAQTPHDMSQYSSPAGTPLSYSGGRPDWPPGHYGQPMYGHMPVSASGSAPGMVGQDGISPQSGHPLSTVYSFVPIPGAQQHKRPRRRFEEIERMYKCGWEGCEKAYGTLNHLNAHVTMQSHGSKRTPEEFKEIRKEWKAKKKEEDNARKQDEDRARHDSGRQEPPQTAASYGAGNHPIMPSQMSSGGPHLPPIGYGSNGSQAAASQQYAHQLDTGHQQYPGAAQLYGSSYPYGQPQSNIYQHAGPQEGQSYAQ